MRLNHVAVSRLILDIAVAEHEPTHVFALYSGGRDSWCSTKIASEHTRFTGVVSVNTGTAAKDSIDYIRATALSFGGSFLELSPPPGDTFEDIVREHGFPGPAQHFTTYIRLKERAIDGLIRSHKKNRFDRIMLVTGVREQESTRRMGKVRPIMRDGATVWVAPIIWWDTDDKIQFLAEHDAPVNPCWQTLDRSGECNCGAFASPGEEAIVRRHHPDVGAMIDRLSAIAEQAPMVRFYEEDVARGLVAFASVSCYHTIPGTNTRSALLQTFGRDTAEAIRYWNQRATLPETHASEAPSPSSPAVPRGEPATVFDEILAQPSNDAEIRELVSWLQAP